MDKANNFQITNVQPQSVPYLFLDFLQMKVLYKRCLYKKSLYIIRLAENFEYGHHASQWFLKFKYLVSLFDEIMEAHFGSQLMQHCSHSIHQSMQTNRRSRDYTLDRLNIPLHATLSLPFCKKVLFPRQYHAPIKVAFAENQQKFNSRSNSTPYIPT